jgi:hypothetical protein
VLFILLIATALLLSICWLCVRRNTRGGYGLALATTWCGIGLSFFVQWSGLLFIAAVLFLVSGACLVVRPKPRWYMYASLALVVGAVAFLGILANPFLSDHENLVHDYPFEPLTERLAYETRSERRPPSVGFSEERLLGLENRIASTSSVMTGKYFRATSLREIHEGILHRFINSPGFGIGRVTLGPNPYWLKDGTFGDVPGSPLQPAYEAVSSIGAEPKTQKDSPPRSEAENLEDGKLLYEYGFSDFLRANRYGYVRDLDHVSGFLPHNFLSVPESHRHDAWQVFRLDLVSLLKFDDPAVYISDRLPAMDELKNAKTRPLDAFEKKALEELQQGEDLRVSVAGDQMRMLGSIRALKQCLKCHQVERGELLGAFSYVLRRQ